jgi:hypothetical protein
MAMMLDDLDTRTRACMVREIDRDSAAKRLYLSARLSPQGRAAYPRHLVDAARHGDPASLAAAIRLPGLINATEISHSKTGSAFEKAVPVNAAETLAEGEFNRFYLRGLCLVAIEDGIEALEIYRAKDVRDPRPESTLLIGQYVNPVTLLDDLRNNPGVEAALCWRHACMGMNPPVMAALNGDVDSGWRAAG